MAYENMERERAPYVAFRTLLNFLDWLQQGVPQRIDRSFWGTRLSGAYGTQLMAALRFFSLIRDDNSPTTTLEELAQGDREQRKAIFRQLLQANYPTVFELDLERATQGQLEEAFKRYKLTGETARKAVTFFVHAARYADVPLSQFIASRIKMRGPTSTRRRRKAGVKRELEDAAKPPRNAVAPSLDWIGNYTLIRGLLERLPEPGKEKFNREEWFALARAVFDAEYGKEDKGQ
jgi:hypothetical protein